MITRYKHLEIHDFVGEPTAAELAAIEKKLGAKLPADFIEFLKVANGGYLPYSVNVPLEGKEEELCFCTIYSTRGSHRGQSQYETFLKEIDLERKDKNAPREVLPFARTGGSSVVYLDLTPEGAGRIVAFVEGLPAWTGLRQNDTYVELADSFSQYVDKLYPIPEDAE